RALLGKLLTPSFAGHSGKSGFRAAVAVALVVLHQAAAQVYYGKSIRELSLAQMAMIAGLPKAPSRFNPLV
ncbi:transglycosylase domain-containing protein, partial [Pseudomonas otitidis]